MEKIKQEIAQILNETQRAEKIKNESLSKYKGKIKSAISFVNLSLLESGANGTQKPEFNTNYNVLEIRIRYEEYNSVDDATFWKTITSKFGMPIARNKTYPLSDKRDFGLSIELDEGHASIFISRIEDSPAIPE